MTATPANKAFTVGYTYSSGRQSGLTYPSGRAIAYGFDAGGRIVSVSVDGSSILASGQYFPFGGIRKWVWANGQSYERTFDKDGRVTTITLGPDTASYGDLSELFGYDSLNRLVSANLAAGQTQSFTYDANSNRTNATINGSSTVYTYPGTSHKLMSLSGGTSRSFTYDNAGNITATGGVTYVYDGRGRMKQAGAVTYLVNGLGQRVRKNTGSDTYFAYDEAGHLIGEYDSSGAPIQETVWLNDTPVAIIKPASPGFTVYNVWTDLLDSPRLVTDTSNNARWEWSNSDPFGNNLPNENPSGLGAFTYNLRFPGQYYDAETGKHYNYFRDYDPGMGRFTESDPVGLLGGPNTYGYTGGRPLQRSDPFGLRAMPSGDLDRDLGWQPSPNDPFRGEADGVCVLACLTVKLALGDFVTRDYQKAEPLLRDRQLGFGSRGTRLTIGRIGRGIGAIGKAFRLTPPGVLIGLGWAIDFCDDFCQHGVGQYSCRANWVDRANMSFRGFGD